MVRNSIEKNQSFSIESVAFWPVSKWPRTDFLTVQNLDIFLLSYFNKLALIPQNIGY